MSLKASHVTLFYGQPRTRPQSGAPGICITLDPANPDPLARFEPCSSRWFWLSPHGAIKCVACDSTADLALVESWVLARETGEGDDGWSIPGEILSLLHITSPTQ